jgi:hypothetical protein
MDPDPQHCPIGKVILQALRTDQGLNDSISGFLCFHTTEAVYPPAVDSSFYYMYPEPFFLSICPNISILNKLRPFFVLISVRIRDPVLYWPLALGSGMEINLDTG